MFYRHVARPLLYALPAETAHILVMAGMRLLAGWPWLLRAVRKHFALHEPSLEVEALGLRFPTPIGLAAGLDKNAEAQEAFGALGFGFVEIGTLTAHPQPGNPRPRLFRLPEDRALINRMGFNNRGAEDAARRLSGAPFRRTLLGVNIGKTKAVANEAAVDDYAQSAAMLAAHADYMVINVSSPNTPGLRDLQAVETLRPLLARVRSMLDLTRPADVGATGRTSARRVPLLLKIAPDLSDEDIDAIADLVLELGVDGIIATNTTIARDGLRSDAALVSRCGAGGLSGAPLKGRALAVLRRLRARVGSRVVLIAAGGIETADDVWDRIRAGATLVQVYTALIYEGPGLPARLSRSLADKLKAAGLTRITEAIGADTAN